MAELRGEQRQAKGGKGGSGGGRGKGLMAGAPPGTVKIESSKSITYSGNKKKVVTTTKYTIRFSASLRRRNVNKIGDPITEALNDGTQNQEICPFNIPPIHVIDIIAFWAFLFFYIMFNCIYWFHYADK